MSKAKSRQRHRSTQNVSDSKMVAVGRIIKPAGLKGQIAVKSLTDFPDRFAPTSVVFLQGSPRVIKESRPGKGRWTISLEGVDALEDAERLRGELLTIPESEVHSLPEREYYQFQLLGLKVFNASGEHLGEVTDVLETGSNEVYVVTKENKELLIPAVADFVLEVDVKGKRMVVDIEQSET